ncbi:MAG: hypothetical protein II712_00260 [Erysipelotrichaceae bacterium]|nr:hypothetical protein [Erysipelotrichaceae bacterium]MBQ4253234.1 hypothetical protein [Erysipelotrichaceae bacterium]
MLELMSRYSGITAIIVYSLILFIFLKIKGNRPAEEKAVEEPQETVRNDVSASPLNLDDEDAVVASLIASIEYHNETKENVRVVSVREIG